MRSSRHSAVAMQVMLLAAGSQYGHAQNCDNLRPMAGSFEYKNRGNRCEGLYVADVGGNTIDLVSLTKGRIAYPLQAGLVLRVSTLPHSDHVHIRAVAIPPRTYYRMDASTNGRDVLEWPVNDVLKPQNLTANRIGVFAWTGDDEDHKLFSPVGIATTDSGPSDPTAYLLVRPSFDVDVVKWRSALLSNGECSSFGTWKDALQGTALAGQPVSISLVGLNGQHCVQVFAQSGTSNDWLSLSIRVDLGNQ